MDWKEKLAAAKALMTDIKTRHESESAEDKEGIPEMLVEYKALMVEVTQLKEIDEATAEMKALAAAEQADEPDQEDSEFKSWGDFLYACWEWSAQHKLDDRLKAFKDDAPKGGKETKDLTEGVGATGGFLVPTEFRAELQAAMGETAIVRPRATIIPMRRRQVDIPVLDQTGTTAGVPHWFGGMQFYWADEATEKTETDPTFRKVALVAHKLIGYTRASDELLDDAAISLEAFLSGPLGFAGGAAWMEDFAFIQGTGAGQPLGVINAGGTVSVARANNSPPFQFVDTANMMEHFMMAGANERNTCWVISQSLMNDVITMQGPSGNASYVWVPNARDGLPGYLLGFPVIWSEKNPVAGTAGDVILANWQYYLIGDRQATTVESTKFDRWRYDQTSWRLVHRVDGQEWMSAPFYLQDGTSTISPFVILGSKST